MTYHSGVSHHKNPTSFSYNEHTFSNKSCIEANKVKEMLSANNCKTFCIPIQFSSLFNSSEIDKCYNHDDHFCAYKEIEDYIWKMSLAKQISCNKSNVEKYYRYASEITILIFLDSLL